MGLVDILIGALIVIALYLLVKWLLATLKVAVPENLLTIGAILLFIFYLLGKVKLGL